jgi:hypothetical protein
VIAVIGKAKTDSSGDPVIGKVNSSARTHVIAVTGNPGVSPQRTQRSRRNWAGAKEAKRHLTATDAKVATEVGWRSFEKAVVFPGMLSFF